MIVVSKCADGSSGRKTTRFGTARTINATAATSAPQRRPFGAAPKEPDLKATRYPAPAASARPAARGTTEIDPRSAKQTASAARDTARTGQSAGRTRASTRGEISRRGKPASAAAASADHRADATRSSTG